MNQDGNTEENPLSLRINKHDDTISNRIKFIKKILLKCGLDPVIDFEIVQNNNKDNNETNDFNNYKDDKDNDIRNILNKGNHDLVKVIEDIGGVLTHVRSDTTVDHDFVGEEKDSNGKLIYQYAVKMVPYKKNGFDTIYDSKRSENSELIMAKLLSRFVTSQKTPHIALPICTFNTGISHFINLVQDGYVGKSDKVYSEFINDYHNGRFHNHVSILISEWSGNRGNLADFIKNKYKKFTPVDWKVLFFQLISTLAVIQSMYPGFKHNNLNARQILVTRIDKSRESYKYWVVGKMFETPNIGYQIKLWNYSFSSIKGVVDNKKLFSSNWTRSLNLSSTQNRYYDIHMFFNTLRIFVPKLNTDSTIPQEVRDFIQSIVPLKYQKGSDIHERGRILTNVEYTTPEKILMTNPYFEEFRINKKDIIDKIYLSTTLPSDLINIVVKYCKGF